jgi:hypothetical protein
MGVGDSGDVGWVLLFYEVVGDGIISGGCVGFMVGGVKFEDFFFLIFTTS